MLVTGYAPVEDNSALMAEKESDLQSALNCRCMDVVEAREVCKDREVWRKTDGDTGQCISYDSVDEAFFLARTKVGLNTPPREYNLYSLGQLGTALQETSRILSDRTFVYCPLPALHQHLPEYSKFSFSQQSILLTHPKAATNNLSVGLSSDSLE
uniref:Uncharacterized protein n=1 Tax=Timema monikensis TaxID=170555 RepID=A0A7R9EHN3_9NEOP|nr:unnamed protein product [Timema monikensis]